MTRELPNHHDITSYYEEWWENERDPRNVVFRKLNNLIARRLPLGHGKRALEIGAGRGTIVDLLKDRGYDVTAVELSESFISHLKQRSPDVTVIQGDAVSAPFEGPFDVVTAIEVLPLMPPVNVQLLLRRLAPITRLLMTNFSNSASLHGIWVKLRGFQKSFVHTYPPSAVRLRLSEAGFATTYTEGVGLVTPITLLDGFRGLIIPRWLAGTINRFGDPLLPRLCHLYYVEAAGRLESSTYRSGKK